MNLLKSVRRINRSLPLAVIAAAVAGAVPGVSAASIEYNLDTSSGGLQSQNVVGAVGGTAVFANQFQQPVGTGVFKPFLSLDANGQTSTGNNNIEQSYNSDGNLGAGNIFLDAHRQQWNNLIKLSDLAPQTIGGKQYYGFVLDANEPGGSKSLISVDNFRVYTSSAITTGSVQNDVTKLDNLGTLRWALNNPTLNGTAPPVNNGFNIDNWIKLNAAQENLDVSANGGSGQADMVVYIPADAFKGANASDYVWVYNLNGVHYAADADLASTAGFEEWSYISGPNTNVPDGGATVALLGAGLVGLGAMRRKLS